MIKTQELLYEKFPQKLIFVTETNASSYQTGVSFTEDMNTYFHKKYNNVEAKYLLKLNFPKTNQKESFLEKAQRQESNFRFGIIQLKWLWKYQKTKPSLVVFLINSPFSEQYPSLIEAHIENEDYMKRKKIQSVFIVMGEEKNEEHRAILKQGLKTGNKNIIFCPQSDPREIFKELESFVNANIDAFYINQVNKYEGYLAK